MLKSIIVKLQVEGVHKWKDCPLNEVDYLRDKHRHIFHIQAKKKVLHNDRDIEIIMFKNEIKNYLKQKYFRKTRQLCDFGNMSCEDIATELLVEFNCNEVQVLEDNENGAIIEV